VNGTVQLSATGQDAHGNTISGLNFTWQSSDGPIAIVSASGLVTGKKAGSVTITATSGTKSGTSSITVTR
jgi:trimeric autotransporter adhesin